jgi:hypothetical protein
MFFFECWPRYHLAEWYDVSERAPRYLLQCEGLDPAQRMFELCVPQLEITCVHVLFASKYIVIA